MNRLFFQLIRITALAFAFLGFTGGINQLAAQSCTAYPVISPSGPTNICDGSSVTLTTNVGVGNGLNLVRTSSQYFITPNLKTSFPTASTSITIELWFKTSSAGVILDELGQTTLNGTFHDSQIEILTSGAVRVRIWGLSPLLELGTVVFGTWNHVVIRFTGATGKLEGFLNGAKSTGFVTGTRTMPSTGAQYWAVGATDVTDLGSGGPYFDGQVDEVRIWNIARSEEEISMYYNQTVPANSAGLVAYYKLDETSGSSVLDATSAARNGTLVNSPTRLIPSTAPISTPFTSYLWSTGATTRSIAATAAGTYSVTATDLNGCTGTTSKTVTINPTPKAVGSNNVSLCKGFSTTLQVTGATGYNWSPATGLNTTTGSTVIANPTATTVYTITAIDPDACSGTITVNVHNLPAAPTITAGGPTTFCSGQTVTLTSSDAAAYLWSNGATTKSITVSEGGSYSVIITDINGCSATSAATVVTVLPLPATPTITPNGPTTFCAGQNVTLTSSAATAYLWSNGATTQSITVSAAGNYSVTVTGINGCKSTSEITAVTVNPLPATPTITADGPTTFCAGGAVTLTSSAALSYLWSNGATTQSILATTSGNYTVTVPGANGCTATSQATVVTANPLPAKPVITAGGPITFCTGGQVQLISSSPSNNLWSTGATGQYIFVTSSGSFSLAVSNTFGCTATSDPVVVTVNPIPAKPTITTSGSTSFCEGSSVTLTSSASANNVWSTGATSQSIVVSTTGGFTVKVIANGCQGQESNITNTQKFLLPDAPTITPIGSTSFCTGGYVELRSSSSASYLWSNGSNNRSLFAFGSGTYTVQVIDGNGCKSAPSAPVTTDMHPVPPTPAITADGSPDICPGGSINLTSSPAVGYLWSNGANTQSIQVSTSGSFYLKALDDIGCQSGWSSSFSTTLRSTPASYITASGPTTFCQGGSVILYAPNIAGYTKLWSTGSTASQITVNSSGVYSLTVTNVYACSSTSSQEVIVGNPISVVGSAIRTICKGSGTTLSVTGASGYTWSPATGLNQITGASVIASPTTTTIYTVTSTDPGACSTTITVNVSEAIPVITASGPTTFCSGGDLVLDAGAGFSSYLWSTGATTRTIHVGASGNYSVTVYNSNGCVGSASKQVTVNPQPTVVGSNNLNICAGSSASLSVTGANGYLWSPADGLNTTSGATVVASPTASTRYTITATDPGSCSTQITVYVDPAASIVANGPTSFCAGDSVRLSAKPYTGNAFGLNGVSNALTTPNLSPAFATSSVTLELWFKADRQGVIVTELGPNQFGNIGVNQGWHNSQIEVLADGKLKIRVGNLAPLELGAVPFAAWQHVALRYNAVTQILDGFLNGVKSVSSVSGVRAVPSRQYWSFGLTDNQNMGSGEFYSGQMDEIRIWNLARTDAQLQDHFRIPVIENSPGLVAYYKFDEPDASTAKDATLSGLDASVWNYSITDATPARQVSTAPLDYGGYSWSTGATSPSILVKETGNYSVTVAGIVGCSAVASQQVTVGTKPVPVGSNTATICVGNSTTLSVTGAGGYSWSPATGLNATTGSSVIASPLVSTTYTVTSTDPGGCSTTFQVNVNPSPSITISANGPTTFCKGGSVTLTALGSENYLWSTGATTANIVVTEPGIYTVTSTNAHGCSSSASQEVKVGAVPQVVGGNSILSCPGAANTVTVTGAGNYLWSPSSYLDQTVGATVTITPYSSLQYTITADDEVGCATSLNVGVYQVPKQVITASGPLSFCSGGTLTLSSALYPGGQLWSTGETGAYILVTTSGSYTVTTINGEGCSSTSDPVNVVVMPSPDQLYISGDRLICEGSSTNLLAAGAYTYYWPATGETTGMISVSPTQTTSYQVQGTNDFGCSKTASITVEVTPKTTYYPDTDGDGFGDPANSVASCTSLPGYVTNNADCNDDNINVHPGAAELCDGLDNDCDGLVDENSPLITYYLDADHDGFGDAAHSVEQQCGIPQGYVLNDTDCNDDNAAVYPGATEICDGFDNDCNGVVDDLSYNAVYFRDNDSDGYGGDIYTFASPCAAPEGYTSAGGDCNDGDRLIHPGALEICDDQDNNCDGNIDEGFAEITYYLDSDADGYGDNSKALVAKCGNPAGYTLVGNDCNDKNASVHPGAVEICDGEDNNCNGQTDEGFTVSTWYPDTDADGFGDAQSSGITTCREMPGYVTNHTDCNDHDGLIHSPIRYYADQDFDGYGSSKTFLDLCTSVTPWGFATNNNDCDDGISTLPIAGYADADGDGYGVGTAQLFCEKNLPAGYSANNTDCDDANANGHTEVMYYIDADGDGFGGQTGQLFCQASPPAGYSRFNSDCDDNDATEQCCVFTAAGTFNSASADQGCYVIAAGIDQNGASWNSDQINLDKNFDLNFNISQFGASNGVMFVLQKTGTDAGSPSTNAGDIGYYNAPAFNQSLAVELDNANSGAGYFDTDDAHMAIVKNGAPTPLSGIFSTSASFTDQTNQLRLTWDHATHLFVVYLNGTQVLSYNADLVNSIFGGNANVYFGFTGMTSSSIDPKAKPPFQQFCPGTLHYENPLKISQSSSLLCNGGQLSTNAAPGCTFLWSTGSTAATIDITHSGTYSVTVANAEGCVTTVSYNATVNAGPTITASAMQLCPEGSITLTSSAAASYLWTTGETTQSIIVNSPGEYNVNTGVCSATIPVSIIEATAAITPGGSTQLCPGETVVLTATEGTSYAWSTGAVTREITVNATGTYTVTISFAAGCTLDASVDVNVGALAKPAAFASNDGHPTCDNPVVYLNQTTYPEYGQYVFTWYRLDTNEPVTPEQPTAAYYTTEAGDYYLVVRRNDCVSEASNTVHVVMETGDASVFGNNAWRVHVWQTGPFAPQNPVDGVYKGYYTEAGLSFDTRLSWPAFVSPSFNPTFNGCRVMEDFFKWSAKRKGVPAGNYNIRIPAYDEGAQLRINGEMVWSDGCCSNSGSNIVWSGFLDNNSTLEFRVNETMGLAFGAIEFEQQVCESPTSNTTVASACDSYTWAENGTTYSTSGLYNSVNGCHTEILDLTITTSSSNTTTATACDSYTWSVNGQTYTASGLYEVVVGCHTEKLNLIITTSANNTTTANACGSYTWAVNGQTYTASGVYKSLGECHMEILDLTITASITHTTTASACDSYTWIVNGQVYTASGLYEKTVGCNTEKLDLTITASTPWYRDADGDGYGNTAIKTNACSAPAGYVANSSDCNDGNAAIKPGATEICDGIDNNCNGTIDEGFPLITYYRDADGDGYGNLAVTTTAKCAAPTGYVTNSSDCNDANAAIKPGATEICDGIDNNCNGTVDEGFPLITYYRDADGDGYGNLAITTTAKCAAPSGYVTNSSDCNDGNAAIKPGATEICDGIDNNCNGTIDEGFPLITYYRDADGDGYGNLAVTTTAKCAAPTGYVTNSSDCNDANAAIKPGATEICDGIDNNCNGTVDEGFSLVTYYRDADGDGYGNLAATTTSKCAAPTGYVTNSSDCNDGNAAIKPGAVEICDGIDNDCDGLVDEGFSPVTYYRDSDGDGYGNLAVTTTAKCAVPAGYVANSSDCNDGNAAIKPGAIEICDGIDNDCDGLIDEGFSLVTYYRDADGDGYGNLSVTTTAKCAAPAGYVTNNSDCNDANAAVRPGATDICDGIDNNCDGVVDEGCAISTITLSIADASMQEGNSGKKVMNFDVTLSKKSDKTVTVNYYTENMSAMSGSDYEAKTGTLTFKPGATQQNIAISIIGDKLLEQNEQFKVILVTSVNASIKRGPATGTIINDDGPGISISKPISASTATVKIAPNPANDITTLQLSGYSGLVRIQLMNSEGKILREEKTNVTGNRTHTIQVPVRNYAAGMYQLIITDEKGNKAIEKLLIVR